MLHCFLEIFQTVELLLIIMAFQPAPGCFNQLANKVAESTSGNNNNTFLAGICNDSGVFVRP